MGVYGANYGANYAVTSLEANEFQGEVKPRLNIATDENRSDSKIDSFTLEAQAHILNQLKVQDTSITINDDPILFSFVGMYASLKMKQFSTPIVRKRIDKVKKNIQDYVNAAYGKFTANGLRGKDTFGTTFSITGDY